MPDPSLLEGASMDDDDLRETVACYALTADPPTTPGCEPHQPQPSGYIARSNWAEVMAWTHEQRTCRGCGLWLIWTPKPGTPESASTGN
jgi:hypothetical protein